MTLVIKYSFLFALLFMQLSIVVAEEFVLKEEITDRAALTNVVLEVQGKLETPQQNETKVTLPIDLKAESRFNERRLASAGRDARAFRALRIMDRTIADIKVEGETVRSTLPPSIKRIVVEGMQEGLFFYSPDVYLSRNHLELITTPGDALCFQPLLKEEAVKVGEEWQVEGWAISMLCTHEASVTGELKCKLESVEKEMAVISFTGQAKGAVSGANSEVKINGKLTFNLSSKFLEKIEAEQTETRAIGTVNPGMDVRAKITINRTPISVPDELSDKKIEGISLDPPDKVKPLVYQSPDWKVQFFHDRNWHIFQELPSVVVLRMVEQGSLVTQANISLVQRAKPGEHTPVLKYQDDIRKSLGDRYGEQLEAKEMEAPKGAHLYRVIIKGKSNNLDMRWHYYLYTNADGRQLSFAFALEEKQAEKLKDRDVAMVLSVHFMAE
jgi:hypothetical protein